MVFETTPTYANLFGTVQRSYDSRGVWTSDFMDLRGGSVLRADGGFLIMYALDALAEVGVWRTLKRTLNHSKLEIQPVEMFFPFGTSALKPESIDLHVKVILIGDRNLYELLYTYEEEFKKIFKVRVEFDEEMEMSDEVVRQYSGRHSKLCEDERLSPFDRTAVAAMIEYGGACAGRRNKATARFSGAKRYRARRLLCRAPACKKPPVTAAHLRTAREARVERRTRSKLRSVR